jgi:hypothetical protein
MEASSLNPLTPQQIAALEAGNGLMVGEDPSTHRVYMLIEQVKPTIDDDYVRGKLQDAQASIDRGDMADFDIEEIKADVRERLAQAGRQSS